MSARHNQNFTLICALVVLLLTWGSSSGSVTINHVRILNSDRVVIFIHGFHGDSHKTFTSSKTDIAWWHIMADDDRVFESSPALSQYDVMTIDYSAHLEQCSSLDKVAVDVSSMLENKEIYRNYNHIWVVAHSMGGLITKRILAMLRSSPDKKLLDRYSGIIFLATPSRGSPLAAVARGAIGNVPAINAFSAFLEKVLGIGHRCQINDLSPIKFNTALQIIETDWNSTMDNRPRQYSNLPRAYCFYEEESMFGIPVVPEAYASTRCDSPPMPLPADHIEISKPSGLGDPLYEKVRLVIEKSAKLTQEHKIKSWPQAQGLGPIEPIGSLIARLQRRSDMVDRSGKLNSVDETIIVEDRRSLELFDRLYTPTGTVYRGHTWADLIESISIDNPCVSASISNNRRIIRLKVNNTKIEAIDNGELNCI